MQLGICILAAVAALPAQAAGQRGGPAGAPAATFSAADRAVIEEAYHLWRSLGDGLWPGWTKVRMPVLLVAAEHEFAAGFPKPLRGFEALPDTRCDGAPVQVRARTFDTHLAASFPVEGISAVVIGRPAALEKSPGEWVITAAHEMFHVLQYDRGSITRVAALKLGPQDDPSWQLNFPFPYKDDDVMRLIHLQGYLAFQAARSQDTAELRYGAGTAAEAAAVYRNVLDRLDATGRSAKYSKFQEWTEGGAFYTEYKLAEAAAGPGYKPTPAFLELPGARGYRALWEGTYRGKVFLAKHAGRAARSRTAFYHLGLAKCLLLDRLDPGWRDRYFGPDGWLDDLLDAALRQAEGEHKQKK
jgi:hypothetical protein